MLGVAMYTTIKTLWETGSNKSEISRLTGHDWKTVSKVIRQVNAGHTTPPMRNRKSMAEPYKVEIIQLLEKGLSGVRVHQELILLGFPGTYSAVKKYIRKLKKKENIFVRVHTPSGQEAQVDFGYVGLTIDDKGKRRKTWVFNMRLSYSRLDYFEKVYNQKVETFINCHANAFEYFGGVPKVVKIDNLKAAILEASFYEPIFQQQYKSFSEHYGFQPIPCRVYHPNDKGKVESGIKYVKGNFFAGRKFTDGTDCDRQLAAWLKQANRRIHGTTRKVPFELFCSEEKSRLLPLPMQKYRQARMGTRRVYHDCHIFVDYNYYSVPFEYVGMDVDIVLSKNLLKISFKGMDIAVHTRLEGKGGFSTQTGHYPGYKQYSTTEYQEKYQAKMAEVGGFAQQLFFLILEKQKNCWQRPVKGILSLSKVYSKEILEASCKRALAYGAYNYQTVKKICETGAYLLPVEFIPCKEAAK